MRHSLIIFVLSILIVQAFSQNTNPKYDSALAVRLGADEYGMKGYILAILKTGSNTSTDKAMLDSCFRGHFRNINDLVEHGKLAVAGPLGKNEKTYRGIFILNASTAEEAAELLKGDDAITAKIFDVEYYNWYGSAALPQYLSDSEKIWRKRP